MLCWTRVRVRSNLQDGLLWEFKCFYPKTTVHNGDLKLQYIPRHIKLPFCVPFGEKRLLNQQNYNNVSTDRTWWMAVSCSTNRSTSELEYQIKKFNPTHSTIFFFIWESLGIIHLSHLDFIWPNWCLGSQESKSSFRKMREKTYNKKSDKRIILSQPAYDAEEGDCNCSLLPSPFQQPHWQICLHYFFEFFLFLF